MPISRRAFLLGSLMLPGWQGRVLPLVPADVGGPIASDGATTPMYSAAHSPAFYDAGLNKTFVAWEAWHGGRVQEVVVLDHATGYFSDIEGMGQSFLTNDAHGNPSIVLDHEAHLHVFYGAHNTDMRHSSTRWPVDGMALSGSKWAVRLPIAGDFTYPWPVMVGSTMYLFMRKTVLSTRKTLVLYKTTALADGVTTWGSETELVDFGASSWAYRGTTIAVGTDIHLVVCKGEDADVNRQHVYYFVYKTATGALTNHDGSYSVASGSLPIGLSDANTNCRLFEHAVGNGGYLPVLAFDTNNDRFVAFSDGDTPDYAGGTSYDLKVIKRSSGSWGAPETVANLPSRFAGFALGALPGGEMELFYRSGGVARKVRSSGGTWGSEQTVLADGALQVGIPNMVRNAHLNARLVFGEVAANDLDSSAGGLKIYLWGAQGLVPYRQAPAAGAVETATDGNELREDDSIELREDDANELREVPD